MISDDELLTQSDSTEAAIPRVSEFNLDVAFASLGLATDPTILNKYRTKALETSQFFRSSKGIGQVLAPQLLSTFLVEVGWAAPVHLPQIEEYIARQSQEPPNETPALDRNSLFSRLYAEAEEVVWDHHYRIYDDLLEQTRNLAAVVIHRASLEVLEAEVS